MEEDRKNKVADNRHYTVLLSAKKPKIAENKKFIGILFPIFIYHFTSFIWELS